MESAIKAKIRNCNDLLKSIQLLAKKRALVSPSSGTFQKLAKLEHSLRELLEFVLPMEVFELIFSFVFHQREEQDLCANRFHDVVNLICRLRQVSSLFCEYFGRGFFKPRAAFISHKKKSLQKSDLKLFEPERTVTLNLKSAASLGAFPIEISSKVLERISLHFKSPKIPVKFGDLPRLKQISLCNLKAINSLVLANCHSIALNNVDFNGKFEFSSKLQHLKVEQTEEGHFLNSQMLRSIQKLETLHFIHSHSSQLEPIQNFLIEAARFAPTLKSFSWECSVPCEAYLEGMIYFISCLSPSKINHLLLKGSFDALMLNDLFVPTIAQFENLSSLSLQNTKQNAPIECFFEAQRLKRLVLRAEIFPSLQWLRSNQLEEIEMVLCKENAASLICLLENSPMLKVLTLEGTVGRSFYECVEFCGSRMCPIKVQKIAISRMLLNLQGIERLRQKFGQKFILLN